MHRKITRSPCVLWDTQLGRQSQKKPRPQEEDLSHDHRGRSAIQCTIQYYTARYYDPGLGRFISADTIVPGANALTMGGGGGSGSGPANPQQLNRYSYVLNNPIKHTDPSGHCIGWIWGAADCQFARSSDQYDWQGAQEVVHTGLSVAGMLPGVGAAPDLINAGLYAAEGDIANAALSAASAIPGAGDELGAARLAETYGDDVAHAVGAMCSFSADTPVLTNGGLVPIAALTPGDQVVAYHEGLQTTGTYTVTHIWSHSDSAIVTLVIDGAVIETTPEHPFFVDSHGWTPARHLVAGTSIRQFDGTSGQVQFTKIEQRPQVMYNLTIAEAHTYFVGVNRWLVHNTCGKALADAANTALQSLPPVLRKATIGAGEKADGNLIYSVYHKTSEGTEAAVQFLRESGLDVLDAPIGRGTKYHAERQLYAAGYKEIGISRQRGMCDACRSYLPRRGAKVTAYEP